MKYIYIYFLICCGVLPAQSYKWDWAMSTGTCPNTAGTYLAPLDEFSVPIGMKSDNQGRLYVLGAFPANNLFSNRNYTIGNSDTNRTTINLSPNYSGTEGLYIYCINANGKIEWAHSLGGEFDLVAIKPELFVNPYSGKVYIKTRSINYVFIDYSPIDTKKKQGETKMILCFDTDGNYKKTIQSSGYLDGMVFASSDLAIYRSSKISAYYPWDDSVSTFIFDANSDTVLGYKTGFLYERIMLYNPIKKVFISSRLHEYDLKLNKVKNSQYTSAIYGHGEDDLLSIFMDKNENFYMNFKNRINDPLDKYWLAKIDKNYKTVWYNNAGGQVGIDTFGNPWVFTGDGLFKTDKLPYRLIRAYSDFSSFVHFINQIDTSTGILTSNRIIPTNMFEQSWFQGQLLIDQNNLFWINGKMLNTLEFGPYVLRMPCYNKAVPLQHYVAKASIGWQSTRKNLSSSNLKTQDKINAYPNPVEDVLNISIANDEQILSIEIYDIHGRIQNIEYLNNSNQLQISTLQAGIYFVLIKTQSNQTTITIIKP